MTIVEVCNISHKTK